MVAVAAMEARHLYGEQLTLNYTDSSARSAGEIVTLGGIAACYNEDVAADTLGHPAVTGVYSVIKDGTSGPVFAVGDAVQWDATNNLAVASGDFAIGKCTKAAGTNEDRVEVVFYLA